MREPESARPIGKQTVTCFDALWEGIVDQRGEGFVIAVAAILARDSKMEMEAVPLRSSEAREVPAWREPAEAFPEFRQSGGNPVAGCFLTLFNPAPCHTWT